MPNVQMPDGQVVGFPEGTADEEIRGFIFKHFPELKGQGNEQAAQPQQPQQPTSVQAPTPQPAPSGPLSAPQGKSAQDAGQGATPPASGEGGILNSVGSALYPASVVRGFQQARKGYEHIQTQVGLQGTEQQASDIAQLNQSLAANAPSPEVQQSLVQLYKMEKDQTLTSGQKIVGTLNWLRNNPSATMALFGESMGSSAAAIAASAGGALVGGAAGMGGGPLGAASGAAIGGAVGAGLGSAAVEYATTMDQFLSEKGFDTSSAVDLENAYANPKLMADAKAYAAKRGIAVGTFDALSSLVGAKGAGRAAFEAMEKATGRVVQSEVGRLAGEHLISTGIEAAGGAAGEAAAGLWTEGKINPVDTTLEFLLEFGPGSVQAAQSVAIERYGNRAGPAASEEDILGAFRSDVEGEQPVAPPTFTTLEEAVASGQENFAVIPLDPKEQEKTPVRVVSKDELEKAAGKVDLRKHVVVAVPKDNVAADPIEIASTGQGQPLADESTRATMTPEQQVALAEVEAAAPGQVKRDAYQRFLAMGGRLIGKPGYNSVVLPKQLDSQWSIVSLPGADIGKSSMRAYNSLEDIKAGEEPTIESQVFSPILDYGVLRRKLKPGQFLPSGGEMLEFIAKTPELLRTLVEDGTIIPLGDIQGASSEQVQQKFVAMVADPNADIHSSFHFLPDQRLVAHGWRANIVGLTRKEAATLFQEAAIKSPSTKESHDNVGQVRFRRSRHSVDSHFTSEAQKFFASENVFLIRGQDTDSTIATRMQQLLVDWMRRFGLTTHRVILIYGDHSTLPAANKRIFGMHNNFIRPEPSTTAGVYVPLDSNTTYIWVDSRRSKTQQFANFAHEFGHLLNATAFAHASLAIRSAIMGAYKRFLQNTGPTKGGQFNRRYLTSASLEWRKFDPSSNISTSDLEYFASFPEWFAEQVSRWATTDRKPLGQLARFFRGVAKRLLYVLKAAKYESAPNETFFAEREMQTWLDSMYKGEVVTNWGDKLRAEMEAESLRQAQSAMGEAAVPIQAESARLENLVNWAEQGLDAISGLAPGEKAQIKATLKKVRKQTDRFNWFYKYALTIRQLAERNPHITALQDYVQNLELAQLEANTILEEAERRIKEWRSLGVDEAGNLTSFLFDLTTMVYLGQDERKQGVRRWPTQDEFVALAKKYGLSSRALDVYRAIRDDFTTVIDRQLQLAIEQAQAINDPAAKQAAIDQAQQSSKDALKAPYFPMMRYGQWAVTVRNRAGKVKAFYTVETKAQQKRLAQQLAKDGPHDQITMATLPEDILPFVGAPVWMLDKLMAMPGMTPQQKDWIEQLRYQLAPARSFQKRFLRRAGRSGYSMDGQRTYATYFFQHARQFARIKYEPWFRMSIDTLRQSHLRPGDQNARTRMADFLEDHLKEFLNPSRDWSLLRSLTAIWHLGFVPASAALNMTQVIVATGPFLATKFGDASAAGALIQAAKDLSSYYRRGTLRTMTDEELRALSQAVEEGIITESMAAELAAISSGGPLSFGGNVAQRSWITFSSWAMKIFQMTEQWNRRVTFRAAYKLAKEKPNAAYVQEVLQVRFLEYQDLLGKGWNEDAATAYIVAKHATLTTQYDYSKAARPRFMRGRKGTLFAFYMFTQNTMFMLWNNPGMMGRYMLAMAFLAGPMGLIPQDVSDVLEAIAKRYLGKDFSLEREARKLVLDLLGPNSGLPPDLLLHGVGRYSMGLKNIMDMVGASWFPSVDMSRAVALNRIIPLSPTKLLDPSLDYNQALVDTTQNLSGAAFGPGLALYKALGSTDLDWTDLKRWEGAMPRALKQFSRASRLAVEGTERDRRYTPTVEYDIHDSEHLAELIAMAAGFTPTRQAQYWDRQTAEIEVGAFWKTRKGILLHDAHRAKYITKDPEEWKDVMGRIKRYNSTVPDAKMRITTKTLSTSMKARNSSMEQKLQGRNPNLSQGLQREVDRLYPEVEITRLRPSR